LRVAFHEETRGFDRPYPVSSGRVVSSAKAARERRPSAAGSKPVVDGKLVASCVSMTPELLGLVSIAAAALTMAVGAVGAATGESRIAAAAMDALARQPDESASITRTLFVSLAMVESTAIFCLVISLILLFANPFLRAAGG